MWTSDQYSCEWERVDRSWLEVSCTESTKPRARASSPADWIEVRTFCAEYYCLPTHSASVSSYSTYIQSIFLQYDTKQRVKAQVESLQLTLESHIIACIEFGSGVFCLLVAPSLLLNGHQAPARVELRDRVALARKALRACL